MICHICKSKVYQVYQVIKKIEIFECEDCRLGFVDQAKIKQDTKKELYDFSSYKKEEKKHRSRLEKLANIVVCYKKSGKVLDVGAGYGLFSSILLSKGKFELEAIDPRGEFPYLAKHKLKVFKGKLEEVTPLPPPKAGFAGRGGIYKKYDLIIMLDVIEHFKDPLANLRKVKRLLKKDGILVIQTPNYKSLMERVCKDWAWWMIEDHKFFFSPKSLKKILDQTGFKSEYFMTYEDWADFRKNLDGNFQQFRNEKLRKLTKVLFFLFFIPFYFLFRKLIWRLDKGGLIFVIIKN